MVEKYKRQRFVTQILVLIIVFITGIIVGNLVNTGESADVDRFMKQNELNTESYLVEQTLIETLGEDSCDFALGRSEDLYRELYSVGQTLTAEDAEDNLGSLQYEYLKNRYHLMQIKNYLLLSKLRDNCGENESIILYYYGDDKYSLEQGFVLDEIVKNYDVKVFAIEYNYSQGLNFLEDYYGIEETPAIVYDYTVIMPGFNSYADIADLLNSD